MSVELVTPVIKDGIELYVSADGTKSGMSQTGLALFCGVERRSMFGEGRIGEKLSQQDPGAWEAPEVLKPFQGRVYRTELASANGAKILTADCCAAFVEYYTFDSKAANETARFSYRKFAALGIHQWIKETSGAIEDHNGEKLLSMMQQVLEKVTKLEEVSTKYHTIREHTSTFMPGADQMLADIEHREKEQIQNYLKASSDGKMSLEGWLYNVKSVTMTKSKFHQFANLVSDTYRSMTQREPEKRKFEVNGVTKYNVSVYEPEMFPILQMCYMKVSM